MKLASGRRAADESEYRKASISVLPRKRLTNA